MKLIRRGFFFSRTEEIMQVNILNQRIGKVKRTDLNKSIYFRTCNIFLFNDAGKLLVQKRSENIKPFPGFWDASPGGVVRINETDLEAVNREIKEEMNLEPGDVKKLATVSIENEEWFWWSTFFKGKVLGEIKKSHEVEDYKFMSIDEIKARLKKGEKFTPGCLKGLQYLH